MNTSNTNSRTLGKGRIAIAISTSLLIALSSCAQAPATPTSEFKQLTRETDDPTQPKSETADREPIGDIQYPTPTIDENTLFSDQVSDILNAFDSNGREVKLDICSKATTTVLRVGVDEMTEKIYAMSDISWSVLEDLLDDCHRITTEMY